MSETYEEIIQGESLQRMPPGERHERICARLHRLLGTLLMEVDDLELMMPRSVFEPTPGTMLHPDVLIRTTSGKPYLIGEIVNSQDHSADTVLKKGLYESAKIPRLWMIDPRYDNLEVYHAGAYGLKLIHILAGSDPLEDDRIPNLRLHMRELFA